MNTITYFKKLDSKRGNQVRDTSKGIFGTSNLEIMKKFFDQIQLSNTNHFVDLGSGDGRVVLLASEYTKATGIEIDNELICESNQHKKELGADAEFLEQDYEEYTYTEVDVLFSFADHFFTPTYIQKLKQEFKGTLYIYEGVFLPEKIPKGKTYWIDQTKIISYTF